MIDKVQTGVRMEKRLAELRDVSLGDLLETIANDALAAIYTKENQ